MNTIDNFHRLLSAWDKNYALMHNTTRQLNESATDRFIEKLIYNKLPDQLKPYVNTTVGTLVEQHPDLVDPQSLGIPDNELAQYSHYPLKDFIRLSISKMFDIGHGKGPKKYLRGIFRIVLDELNYLRHPDMNAILSLKDDVMYIMQAAQNNSDPDAVQMDANLNGMSAQQLHNTFKEKRKAFTRNLRDRISSMFRGKTNGSEYKVIPVLKHEDAVKYSPYTSWCITYDSPANYDQYTSGGRRFYIFLKNGFEQIPEERGENCPMDEYGMSMISVLVDMEGNIDLITTRWNHQNDGEFSHPNENTVMAFQNAMGVDLYGVCKPYTREELKAMGIILFDEVPELLAQGVDPRKIFSQMEKFSEGFGIVKLNDKYNYINAKGEILSPDQWFDYCWNFKEGFAIVELYNGWNYINTKGEILSPNKWFDQCWQFSEGFSVVELNDNYNYINTKGELLSNQWFDYCFEFFNGFARVNFNGKEYKIDKYGKLYDGEQQVNEAIDRVFRRFFGD